MADLEDLSQHLDALKGCPASEFHAQFSAALRRFRFVPAAERRACTDAFFRWADARAADAPLVRAYAVFLQGMEVSSAKRSRPPCSC